MEADTADLRSKPKEVEKERLKAAQYGLQLPESQNELQNQLDKLPVLKKRREMLSLDITTPENECASGAVGEGTSRFLPQKETQSCPNQAEGDLQLEKSVSTNTPVAPLPPHKNLPVNVQLKR
uniref:Uncharacterized protein n=1 Tax=Sciurus vulgaris TaxID=55149 RepID=A0A8D2AU19_SCIVU